MDIQIDRNSNLGLSRQISDQIRDLIRRGVLQTGDRLPSTRLLSKDLEVNRVTVSQAYNRLIQEGLVRTGVGSGTYVDYSPVDRTIELDRSNYKPRFSQGIQVLMRSSRETPLFNEQARGTVNFATLAPDERFFPEAEFRKCLNHVLDQKGANLLQYCGTLGYGPLREYIAARMDRLGIQASPERILIVNGSQQGLDLVLRCFLARGDRVAMSLPSYHNIFPIIEHLRADVAPVSMMEGGPDLNQLREVAQEVSTRLIYTMPNFQNPTSVTCDQPHREGIYRIASETNLPILEDDFEFDLTLGEEMAQPIKALDEQGRVIYLSTFSKSLFPGLRIGWLVAGGETFNALAALKKATDLENSALLQAAVHEFCRRGLYDEHIQKMRALIRERMETAQTALTRHMPEGVQWSRPSGGYALWIRLPTGLSSESVFEAGKTAGVLVSPGTLFSMHGNDPGGIRLSLSRCDEGAIDKGIQRLGKVITDQMQRKSNQASLSGESPQHL